MKTISWQAGAEKAGVQIPVLMYSLDPLHLWQHTCENHSESFKRVKGPLREAEFRRITHCLMMDNKLAVAGMVGGIVGGLVGAVAVTLATRGNIL